MKRNKSNTYICRILLLATVFLTSSISIASTADDTAAISPTQKGGKREDISATSTPVNQLANKAFLDGIGPVGGFVLMEAIAVGSASIMAYKPKLTGVFLILLSGNSDGPGSRAQKNASVLGAITLGIYNVASLANPKYSYRDRIRREVIALHVVAFGGAGIAKAIDSYNARHQKQDEATLAE